MILSSNDGVWLQTKTRKGVMGSITPKMGRTPYAIWLTVHINRSLGLVVISFGFDSNLRSFRKVAGSIPAGTSSFCFCPFLIFPFSFINSSIFF